QHASIRTFNGRVGSLIRRGTPCLQASPRVAFRRTIQSDRQGPRPPTPGASMRAGIGNETTGKAIDATSTAARSDALIRVSEALRGYHDREALFGNLAKELRPVVWFSFLGLTLYDEQTHTVQRYVLEGTGEPVPPPHVDAGQSVAYWVVQHQEPLVFPFEDAET